MIIIQNVPTFDGEIVKCGGLIRAKYRTWTDFRNGLVSRVQPDKLTVLFQTGANATVSYFVIRAAEAADDHWQIFYSSDMEEIYHVGTN